MDVSANEKIIVIALVVSVSFNFHKNNKDGTACKYRLASRRERPVSIY